MLIGFLCPRQGHVMIVFCQWVGSSSLSTKRERVIVVHTVVRRARGLSSWYKDGMILSKEILPKISSSMSGVFVLAEGVL